MDLLSFTHVLVMHFKSEIEQAMKLEIRHDMIPVWRVAHSRISIPELIQPCSRSMFCHQPVTPSWWLW